jgi:hypothetical protein
MNDRASFDVLVAPRVGSVIEAQQQAFAMPRKELKCVTHLVRERPLGHAEMTRMEAIMLAAGWSTALVAVFIRLIGIG